MPPLRPHVAHRKDHLPRELALDRQVVVYGIRRRKPRVEDVQRHRVEEAEVYGAPRWRRRVRVLVRNRRNRSARLNIRERRLEAWMPTYVRDASIGKGERRSCQVLKREFFLHLVEVDTHAC